MKKKNKSTQSLFGVKEFSRNGIQTNGHGEIVFFLVSPTNISVLSGESIAQKIKQLTTLFSVEPNMEILCIDSRENFEDNKLYLSARTENESNKIIKSLLLKDNEFLDNIQLQMSTSREFMFAVRLRNESEEQTFTVLTHIEKAINDQGFHCRKADYDSVKKIIARYCGINTGDLIIDDFDGDSAVQKWIIPD